MTASDLCPIFRRPHSATRRLHGHRGPEQAGHGVRGGAVRRGEGEGQVPFITKIFEFQKNIFYQNLFAASAAGSRASVTASWRRWRTTTAWTTSPYSVR